ncbi:NAD(+) synthase [Blattabacterium cuenoti]|uniref:NAD(+) synthase n=1 Tax=Blattabacterium cuenoti TaxID=1653831 RepID=UPI00163C6A6C|nr:NAD(+) synthase [Blattabacterium cuenoti]
MKVKKVIKHIVLWLKEYIKKYKLNGFVIGISGGIDSSVSSCLTAMTNYPTLVLDIIFSKKINLLSEKHAKFLLSKFRNVFFIKKNIKTVLDTFCDCVYVSSNKNNIKNYNKKKFLALANIKSRLIMLTLYYYANINNYLVVGTGNKIEDFGVGFFTKYGDGGVDLLPIADLNKSEIGLLAKELNIINDIQNAKPTDGLWDDRRSDEDQLGATYEELEWAMKYSNENYYDNSNLSKLSKNKLNILKIYKKLNNKNYHKFVQIPVCKIPHNILK